MIRSLYCTPETIILCATVLQKKNSEKISPKYQVLYKCRKDQENTE